MKWISVKDELPKIDCYLIGSNGDYVSELFYHSRTDLWMEVNSKNSEPFDDITHWMPLPKPPTK